MSLKLADLKTGYFADPEKPEAPFPFVHAIKMVVRDREAVEALLCPASIPPGHEYQWCSNAIEFTYVDCQPCRNILDRMALVEGRGKLALFRHPSHV